MPPGGLPGCEEWGWPHPTVAEWEGHATYGESWWAWLWGVPRLNDLRERERGRVEGIGWGISMDFQDPVEGVQ